MADAPSRTPTFVALALVAVAVAIAALGGLTNGSWPAAIVAFAAVVPACIGMWQGVQERTQLGLGLAVSVFLLALAVAAILLTLELIDWIR